MNRHPLLLSAACLALICCAAVVPLAAAQETSVLAQDLRKLRVSGKVSAVLWTRRTDSCTLQVVLPRQPQGYASIQIWLLKSDGTQIPPMRRWETPATAKTCLRCIASEVEYSFPLAAGGEAVAAAISIDGDYYIERLATF